MDSAKIESQTDKGLSSIQIRSEELPKPSLPSKWAGPFATLGIKLKEMKGKQADISLISHSREQVLEMVELSSRISLIADKQSVSTSSSLKPRSKAKLRPSRSAPSSASRIDAMGRRGKALDAMTSPLSFLIMAPKQLAERSEEKLASTFSLYREGDGGFQAPAITTAKANGGSNHHS